MSGSTRKDGGIRERLRAYLLGTLPESERTEVESQLAASEDLRTQLDAERAALAKLDVLPDIPPKHDLAIKVMADVRAQQEKEQIKHRKWHLGYLVEASVVAAILLILAGTLLPSLSRSREAARRASGQNNLKQLGIALKMYANESKGELFPTMAPQEGVWGIDVSAIYPKFLTDIAVLVDPRHPHADRLREKLQAAVDAKPIDWALVNRLAAESYTYFGWGVKDADTLARLKDALPRHSAERMELAENFESELQIYRLREGIERFFISEINDPAASARAQAEIPVMFETRSDSIGGKNVLYMDGHVKCVPYGDAFPATPEADRILGLDSGR